MPRADVLLAILAMAAVTFLCRAGGYFILRATRPPPVMEALLRNLPGPLFAAYVALTLSTSGPAGWLAAVPVVLAQWLSGSLVLAILAGVGTVALLQPWLG